MPWVSLGSVIVAFPDHTHLLIIMIALIKCISFLIGRQAHRSYCPSSQPLEHAYHLSFEGGPKSPTHIFFVLTNSCFYLGASLSEQVMF